MFLNMLNKLKSFISKLILLWSRPWLAHFRYGPLEWIWRSLVQWKRQPFRKATA